MLNHFLRWSRRLMLATLWVAAGAWHASHAQPVTPGAQGDDLYASAQRWVNDMLSQQRYELPLRMEVVVGQLDRRLSLAPCAHVEPYLPPNVRLWGKTRLGLRCVQGAVKWNVFLPITVKAMGPAWVIKGQVAPGATLQASDAMAMEVDWAEGNAAIVANQSAWVGKAATRLLSTGQALRQDMVKAAQVFQTGAQVRVVAVGVGFEIATRAQALSAGVIGQNAMVRMDNGQVITGTVSDERTVRVVL
ncbi:flagellar basal body P-ring formation chaperone FlgA [Rhodoferax sp. U11-2br]|uniref:flagellar basal body P-ring formation chaperone FlgA n=1 Tax=Rhodoferax sp. U11-2br TaxID=2838878 RepID=UPI001BEBE164|nr:flagellar basal body P-ring formation chaperone FlgA [Rhodoferax sp. U11-2br]MBT3067555.1 flagellar basal body P-ring formation protein FlgA [Rhodoferax sp. U11-2br]